MWALGTERGGRAGGTAAWVCKPWLAEGARVVAQAVGATEALLGHRLTRELEACWLPMALAVLVRARHAALDGLAHEARLACARLREDALRGLLPLLCVRVARSEERLRGQVVEPLPQRMLRRVRGPQPREVAGHAADDLDLDLVGGVPAGRGGAPIEEARPTEEHVVGPLDQIELEVVRERRQRVVPLAPRFVKHGSVDRVPL